MPTEQPNDQSGATDNSAAKSDSLKSVTEFKSLSLNDMEKELSTKDYSKADPLNLDQGQQDSANSDEDSKDEQDNSSKEQTSEEESDVKSEDTSESDDTESDESDTNTDKQKKEDKISTEERLAAVEKSNKELQAEFTRRSQRLKELEKENADLRSTQSSKKDAERTSEDDSDPELAQLKEKDPKAYDVLNKMIDRIVDKRVTEKVKPVEEQVTLRRRQENVSKFDNAIADFTKSPLAELEPQMVEIINENPSEWQRAIWERGDKAFQDLEKELLYRHRDRAAKLISQAEKSANDNSDKQERLKKSQVGTKTKVSQPARGVTSDDDFKKLSLDEMEKRLPRVRN